jgi:hypothetical protein
MGDGSVRPVWSAAAVRSLLFVAVGVLFYSGRTEEVMLRSKRTVALVVIGVLVAVAAFIGSRATASPEPALRIAAQPGSGAAGTTVTVTGQGAAPNAYVTINGGYRQATAGCPVAAGGDAVRSAIFAHTTADGAGNYSATFRVLPNGGEYGQAYFTAFSPATAHGLSTMVCFDIAK